MSQKKAGFLLWCFFIWSTGSKAQDFLQKGNEAFFQNKRKEAAAYYQKAIASPKEKAEAHLMLSLLATQDGDEKKAFVEFEQFFKTSDNPYPTLFSLWSTPSVFGTQSKKSPERVKFFHEILADPKANGTLKAMANAALGDHYFSSNQVKKATDYFSKIGAVDTWSLAGEFENISESGFDKPFEPITKPREDAVFTNKNGAKVKWNIMKGNRMDKWMDFTFHYFTDNSILFGQTFVNSPETQDAYLLIGTSGSLKAWVNDALVLAEAEERNNDLDTYQSKIKLNKGFNRILVQIGSSEINRSNFLVRICNENGHPLPNLSYQASYQTYSQAQAAGLNMIPIFAEAYFENEIKKNKSKVVNYLLLANTYLRNDKGYEARKALSQAAALAPECGYIKIKQIEAFNRSGNETDSKITISWLKDHDPESLLALNLFFQEELEKENLAEAGKILNKIEQQYGENQEVMLQRIGLLSKEKNRDALIRIVDAAYAKYPDFYPFVNLKLDVEKSINKSYAKAQAVLKKYLKTNYSYEAQKALSDLHFGNGQQEQGLAAYKIIIDNSPYSPGYKYNLAQFYYTSRNYAKAEELYLDVLANSPDIFYFWSALGQNYVEKGNKPKAIEAYKRALELNPGDFTSREEIRKLENKKEVFAYFPKFDVYDIIKKAPSATEREESSIILLDDVQKVVYAGGASEELKTFVVKILTAEGINRWKQYYIEHNSMQSYDVEKAEVVKANGSKVEASLNEDEVVFTSLEPGDAFHVRYKLKNANTGKLARHFWEAYHFLHYLPYQTTRYSILAEQGVNFNYTFSKDPIQPKIENQDEFKLYIWEKENQEAIVYEDKMPELSDVGNQLFISTIPDWTFVSNWYWDLAASKSKVNLEVKEAVKQVLEGKENQSEMQKARLIYTYIVNNIKYLSVGFLQSGLIPQKASHTLNTKLGDCKDVSTLFVAMCKEAGLKADLVLIATRNQGKYQMLLPSIDFNHCIARLEVGGQSYYIELTSDKLPFNTFYDNLKNANSLLIVREGNGEKVQLEYLNPSTRNLNKVIRKSDIVLDGSWVKVKKNTLKTGVYASNMRDVYRGLGGQDQFKEMQRAIVGEFQQTQLKTLKFQGLEGVSDTVSYQYDYTAPEGVAEIGGLKLLPLPWSEKAKPGDFAIEEDRKYPIDLWTVESDGEEESMSIGIPAGNELAEMPKNVQISNPVADYSLTFKTEKGRIWANRTFRFKKDSISLSEMKEFDKFYRQVISADNRQLALKAQTKLPASSPKKSAK